MMSKMIGWMMMKVNICLVLISNKVKNRMLKVLYRMLSIYSSPFSKKHDF